MGLMRKESGQGLTEYLILLCLVAVASISVVSVVGQNLRARYASISSALRGDSDVDKELESVESSSYDLKGFEDYTESSGKQTSHRRHK